jgi:hypothetical protein
MLNMDHSIFFSSIQGDLMFLDSENSIHPIVVMASRVITNRQRWGMAVGKRRVFVFEGELPEAPYHRESRIVSYDISATKGTLCFEDPVVEVRGLDAGIHQMYLHEAALYVLDTNWQRILHVPIDSNEHRVEGSPISEIRPFPDAVSYRYVNGFQGYDQYRDRLTEYRHINAITRHDGRWYVNCPYIMSGLIHPHTRDAVKWSEIAVFDDSWTLIDVIHLSYKGVHDLVFDSKGSLWYLSYDFRLVCFDVDKKCVVREIALNRPNSDYRWCRGLYFDEQASRFVVGVSKCIQIVDADSGQVVKVIETPSYPCFIARTYRG